MVHNLPYVFDQYTKNKQSKYQRSDCKWYTFAVRPTNFNRAVRVVLSNSIHLYKKRYILFILLVSNSIIWNFLSVIGFNHYRVTAWVGMAVHGQ